MTTCIVYQFGPLLNKNRKPVPQTQRNHSHFEELFCVHRAVPDFCIYIAIFSSSLAKKKKKNRSNGIINYGFWNLFYNIDGDEMKYCGSRALFISQLTVTVFFYCENFLLAGIIDLLFGIINYLVCDVK